MVLASDPLRVRLSVLPGITAEHVEAIARLQWLGLPRIVRPRMTVEEEHQPTGAILVVRRGWAFASKLLPNGGRQVVDFFVPGDVIGGAAAFLPAAQQTCETVTETVLTEIPLETLHRAGRESPALMEALMAVLASDRARLTDRLVDLGRRDSVGRVAHLLLDLWRRLHMVGGATVSGYPCPLSQYLIADATGLTAIHVNRVLRELRETGLLTFRHSYVKFHHFGRLADLAGFDEPTVGARPLRRSAEAKGVA
jgi:CRP-like cAMP-binding protein